MRWIDRRGLGDGGSVGGQGAGFWAARAAEEGTTSHSVHSDIGMDDLSPQRYCTPKIQPLPYPPSFHFGNSARDTSSDPPFLSSSIPPTSPSQLAGTIRGNGSLVL
ncbi:hypothetical protein BT69DRAFT_1333208 [Atractiella rhizophila]|nr:hypothetical protein BT69DRAFT_1333208 [Atractiella rhizophila]